MTPQPGSNASTTTSKVVNPKVNSLLATKRIIVRGKDDQQLNVWSLVVQCAQSSFVTEELCQKLRLKKRKINFPISVIRKKELNCHAEVELIIRPHSRSTFSYTFNTYVLSKSRHMIYICIYFQ